MDIYSNTREPIEVYEAAVGNPEPLALRIESKAVMNDWERSALAAFLRGELVPPKRQRGQKTIPFLKQFTTDSIEQMRIVNAVTLLRAAMKAVRKSGKSHYAFPDVVQELAEYFRLSPDETERVINRYRRTSKADYEKLFRQPRGVVEWLHLYLLETGRPPDFPQPTINLRDTEL